MYNTLSELFANFNSFFKISADHPQLGPYQLNFTGTGGGQYVATINGTQIVFTPGTVENPVSVMEADTASFLAVYNGEKTFYELLSTGKMKFLKGHQGFMEISNYSTRKQNATE